MNYTFVIGMVVGLVIAIFVCKTIFKKTKMEYDERQQIEQGKACKYAFYFIIGYMVLLAYLIDMIKDDQILFILQLSGVIISVIIYGTYCIWKEAYFPINQSSKRWIFLFFVIAGGNITVGVLNMRSEDALMHSSSFVNLSCAALLIVVSAVAMIKLKLSSKEMDEDEEEEDEKFEA